ncbi:uracil-DNA glycosylase-like protein [Melampsora americana]|nr:uracil-DNA glycosylase-like protein [Melampsora americana]
MSSPKSGEKRQRSITDMFGIKPSRVIYPKPKLVELIDLIFQASSKTSMIRISYTKLPKIDHESKLKTLSKEHQDLLSIELNPKIELTRTYFLNLKRFLQTEPTNQTFPPPSNIYSWSHRTPLTSIKVVIIGQDPYHAPGQAHGLAFSVPRGIPIPGSLRNGGFRFMKNLNVNTKMNFQKPNHGSLGTWADHGVLLLNTSLTVRKSSAGSHAGHGWEQFTDSVVDAIDLYGGLDLLKERKIQEDSTEEETEGGSSLKKQKLDDHQGDDDLINQSSVGFGKGVVFLCWGKWAADRVTRLSESKHLILKSAHPSPLSAHRGFLGNGHFKLANEWLANRYGKSAMIDWCDLKPDLPINNP